MKDLLQHYPRTESSHSAKAKEKENKSLMRVMSSFPIYFFSDIFLFRSLSFPIFILSDIYPFRYLSFPISYLSDIFPFRYLSLPTSYLSDIFPFRYLSFPISFLSDIFPFQYQLKILPKTLLVSLIPISLQPHGVNPKYFKI